MSKPEATWYFTEDQLPETNGRKSVKCICEKRYERQGNDKLIVSYHTEVLCYDPRHKCWDDADGDDYNCDLNQVRRWTYLPYPPLLPKED